MTTMPAWRTRSLEGLIVLNPENIVRRMSGAVIVVVISRTREARICVYNRGVSFSSTIRGVLAPHSCRYLFYAVRNVYGRNARVQNVCERRALFKRNNIENNIGIL